MHNLDETRSVWVEINLDNLAHNVREIKKNINDEVLLTAVTKANGYGHGAVEVARVFLENGADRLAVASLEEAIELRKAGIISPILVLGGVPQKQHSLAVKWNIIETIFSYENAENLSKEAKKLNKVANIHIKMDTGLNRIGFLTEKKSIEEIKKINKLPNLKIEGIFTHFAKADEKDKTFTHKQFERFEWTINELEKEGIYIPIKHVSNSAAIIDLQEYNLDMVRAGIMLYGLYPSDNVKKSRINLKPAMTLKAKISHIKKLPPDVGISYGHIFFTKKESIIGTIPIGYADGFTRLLSSRGEAFIRGKRVPVVGKICMDQCMIDLTDVEDAKVDDEVIIFGDGKDGIPHIDEVAKKIGTVNYEVVCMIGRRIPRVYIKNGKVVKIIDYLLD